MPKIALHEVEGTIGTGYPDGFNKGMELRSVQRLSEASGLTQFGANLVTLEPGGLSALRHWHEEQDEFAMVTAGSLTLVDDSGETTLGPGDCVAFPKSDANGHQIINKSSATGTFLVIGTRTPTEIGHYPDHDLKVAAKDGAFQFTHKDGTPY